MRSRTIPMQTIYNAITRAGRATIFGSALLATGIIGCASGQPARPVQQIEQLTELPKQIRSGKGTKKDKYVVYPESNRLDKGKAKGVATWPVKLPIVYEISGERLYFEMNVTLSQLTKNSIRRTKAEIKGIIRDAVKRNLQQRGMVLELMPEIDIGNVVEQYAAEYAKLDKNVKAYLEGK